MAGYGPAEALPTATGNMHENLMFVDFELCEQTDRHTDTLIGHHSRPLHPCLGKVKIGNVKVHRRTLYSAASGALRVAILISTTCS